MNELMTADLDKALEASRPAIEGALAEAEAELAAVVARKDELERLIARARAALGEPSPATEVGPAPRGLTLHEALKVVLDEHDNRWMTVTELAEAINSRDLYRKRDGSPVQPSQIHARASSYPSLFEKDGPRIRLADGSTDQRPSIRPGPIRGPNLGQPRRTEN